MSQYNPCYLIIHESIRKICIFYVFINLPGSVLVLLLLTATNVDGTVILISYDIDSTH